MSGIWGFVLGFMTVLLILLIFYLLARVNTSVQNAYNATVCSL